VTGSAVNGTILLVAFSHRPPPSKTGKTSVASPKNTMAFGEFPNMLASEIVRRIADFVGENPYEN
jgi:hypothetical protein